MRPERGPAEPLPRLSSEAPAMSPFRADAMSPPFTTVALQRLKHCPFLRALPSNIGQLDSAGPPFCSSSARMDLLWVLITTSPSSVIAGEEFAGPSVRNSHFRLPSG